MMASKNQTIIATLHRAERLMNSVNGNPRWKLHTSEGPLVTKSDASLGYEVSNRTGGPGDWTGKRVQFTATKAGRVFDWKLA